MDGKVILITGASSGIGAEVALLFASLNFSLSLLGRNGTALRETGRQCLSLGLPSDRLLLLTADLTSDEEVESSVSETVDKLGRLDVLINSAGVVGVRSIVHYPMHLFDEQFHVNVRAVYYLIRTALPHLSKTGGSVVNLSAGCASSPFKDAAVYCASKVALDSLTKSLALEVSKHRVRINSVTLGSIPTGVHQRIGLSKEVIDEWFDPGRVPLGRVGTVGETAQSVLFLADSRRSSFVTGVVLASEGGGNLYGSI